MKDLDFDELDKAVNSLMSDAGKKPDDTADTQASTAEAPVETPAPDAAPTADAETPIPAPDSAPIPTPSAVEPAKSTPVAKRRGQFMDVVHPSSDMRTANKATPATGRVGVTVVPPTAPAEPSTPATPADPVATAETQAAPNMPDPIDMQTPQQDEPVAPVESPTPEPTVMAASDPIPSGTPFLPDAQVEKRPLGGATPAPDAAATSETVTESPIVEAPIPVPTEPPVIETAPTPATPETPTPEVEESTTEPAPEAPKESAELDKPADPIVTTVEPIREQPTPPSAISQQYKEQESTGDKDHAAIYDSAAVDVPLIHPAKPHSGWLWVVWTLLLIIVGALGTATLWYFKII